MKGLNALFLIGALGIASAASSNKEGEGKAGGRGLSELLGLNKNKGYTGYGPAPGSGGSHHSESTADSLKLKIYTSKSIHAPIIVTSTKNLGKATEKFNKDARVKLIIPDWQYEDGTELVPAQNIKNAYAAKKRPENVIIVDWTGLSSNFDPQYGVETVRKAGKKIVEYISVFIKEGLIKSPKDIDIIGMGGGAQVAAIVGEKIKKKEDGSIARISALDPTGPGFDKEKSEDRLDESDATFVDVMHCNHFEAPTGLFKAWTTWHNAGKERYMGTNEVVGHIDTFVNGGYKQPGCDGLMGHLDSCSHTRCFDLYALSIRGYKMIACECEDWATFVSGSCDCKDGPLIGDPTPSNSTGVHYIKTLATAQTKIPKEKNSNGTSEVETSSPASETEDD